MNTARQCRICFDTEEITRFVSPCRCRGSQAYIHTHCLALYFQHFPDGVCRVCQCPMQIGFCDDQVLLLGTGVWMVSLMLASSMPVQSRIVYLTLVAGVLMGACFQRQVPLRFLTLGLLMSGACLVVPIPTLFWMLTGLTGVLTCMVLWLYIPTPFLLLGLTVLLSAFYSALLVIFALLRTDPTFSALLVCVVGCLWYLMLRARPSLRNV